MANKKARVLVFADGGRRCIDLIDDAAARRMAAAPNAKVIRRRKDRRIVEVHLANYGDDSKQNARQRNPLKYSRFVRQETEHDPTGMWTLKYLPRSTADLFGAVVNECVKSNAA